MKFTEASDAPASERQRGSGTDTGTVTSLAALTFSYRSPLKQKPATVTIES